MWRAALARGTWCWIGGGVGDSSRPATPLSSTTGTNAFVAWSIAPAASPFLCCRCCCPATHFRSRLRSRRAVAPRRPAIRPAAGRPRSAVVCWRDHTGAGRSATRQRLQVSKRLRDRSSVVSTSSMVDTILVPSRRNILCAVNCALTIDLYSLSAVLARAAFLWAWQFTSDRVADEWSSAGLQRFDQIPRGYNGSE